MILDILRRERGSPVARREAFIYEPRSAADTVATALQALNNEPELRNAAGEPARQIEWSCSCLQKKCGACAMRIEGRPRLACDARLSEFPGGTIRLEPLSKFPVVCDLVIDRSILFENLKTLRLWLTEDAELDDEDRELAYESSACLQCGCCLEVCPNFYAGGSFTGMAAVPVTTRLLSELPKDKAKEIARQYIDHVYEGCGKSLACKAVCPKKIDTEKLLVSANAMAVWKRKRKKKC